MRKEVIGTKLDGHGQVTRSEWEVSKYGKKTCVPW